MTIHERVRRLAEEFGPEPYERGQLFLAELSHHLREVDREAREDCRRAAAARAECAAACGDAAGSRAAAEVAQFIADGKIEP